MRTRGFIRGDILAVVVAILALISTTCGCASRKPQISWGVVPPETESVLNSWGPISAEYHYDGSFLVGLTSYSYFEVTARSGDVELTTSIEGEVKSGAFPVEEGGMYQLSVYIGVMNAGQWSDNRYLLTVDSPSAAAPLEITVGGQLAFVSLGEIGVAPYEP